MVQTRRNASVKDEINLPKVPAVTAKNIVTVDVHSKPMTVPLESGSIKSEIPVGNKMNVSRQCASLSRKSSSSIEARRKRLELQAAEAKARINMDLIEKRLAADIADLEDEKYSSHSEGNHSQHVHILASALKDLAAASSSNNSNAQMLSRLCTPRDLPAYFGDPLEWLQFKQAFEESTRVCNFSDQENLWRLRKCLLGPAKDAVTALLISATSPTVVMSTLELQFGNPDIIISKIMYDIKKLPPVCPEYHKDIISFSIKVKNYVAAVLAIGQEEYLKGTNVTSIILSKLPTVLISKWADYSFKLIQESSKPKLILLSEFLNEEAIKISKTSVNISYYNPSDYKRKLSNYNIANRTHTVLVQNSGESEKCRYCRASCHNLPDCKKFKKALQKDKWQFVKRAGLCYRCLVSRHNRESCTAPVCAKDNCGQSHHRLLHYIYGPKQQTGLQLSENTPVPFNDRLDESRNETVMHVQMKNRKVLLKTVPICVHGPNGVINTVALLDDGSTRLGVHGCKQTLRVRGAWECSDLVCNSELVNLTISNIEGTIFNLQLRSTNGLNLPSQCVSLDELLCSENFENIRHLLCNGLCKPEILIGQDNYNLLVPLQITQGTPNGPYLTRTPLGWCVHGCVSTLQEGPHSMLFLSGSGVDGDSRESEKESLHDLHETVRQSFSIEAMGVSRMPCQNSEHVKATEHLERTSMLKDGRWHVGLPWKDSSCKMPESFKNACNRLKGVWTFAT
ncbi:hypothetical protein K1T71_015174 [Dendrolimus kikuchii]|nr:hypothetical protein K1T71_015174 [Dendrolimus kikuchii]